MNKYIRNIKKNSKGLSPIFAVLILIAIAVIAGIIVYMFTSGYLASMMGGGTAAQEKVAIQSVQVKTATTLTIYAKSTGGGDIMVTDVIIRDSSGNQVGAPITLAAAVKLPAAGTLTAIDVTVPALATGVPYTASLVTQAGNQFVSPSFKGV